MIQLSQVYDIHCLSNHHDIGILLEVLPSHLPFDECAFFTSKAEFTKIEDCTSFFSTIAKRNMKVRSLWYCDFLSEEDILRHECSDRIWLPRHMFERWLLEEDAGTIIVAKLETIAVCVYGPHSGPADTIYAPSWICHTLGCSSDDEEDYIVPIRFKPQTCSFLTLQPHTSHHLQMETEPEEALAAGIEQYTCIQKGQTIEIRLANGERQFVSIVSVHSGTTNEETEEALSIRNPIGDLEISLELLPPLDAPLPIPPIDRPPTPPPSPPTVLEPEPVGYQLDPTQEKPLSKEEVRALRCRMFEKK